MITRRKSQGSALIAVLMILLILMAGVSAFQYLASSSLRQYRQDLLFEDHQARADGILEMMISRWKTLLSVESNYVTWLTQSDCERGSWDGHEFVMGWYLDWLDTDYPTDRVVFWVRFLDQPTPRAYRYDLMFRMPFQFKPRLVELMGCSIEAIDPEDPDQREASWQATVDRVVRPPASEALVESFSEGVEFLAGAGETPDKIIPLLTAAPAAGLETFLTQHASLGSVWDPLQKRDIAAGLIAPSAGLSRKWQDLAHFELAQALITCGNWEVGAERQSYFQQAVEHLTQALRPDPRCCGEPIVTWILANLMIRMRQPINDPDVFRRARQAATQRVQDMVAASPDRYVHERTEIKVEELPSFLDAIWKSRVAVGASTGNSKWVITTMLDDGSKQLVHYESTVTPNLLAWESDGGHWLLSTMDGDESASGEGIWRVPIFGTKPELIAPDPFNFDRYPPICNIAHLRTAPDGGMFASGTLDPDLTRKVREPYIDWQLSQWDPNDPGYDRQNLGDHETDLSTAHSNYTGELFRLAIRGRTVHQVFAFEEDWYEPFVFSQDGKRIAYLVSPLEEGEPTNVVIVDSDRFWRGETPLTYPVGTTDPMLDLDLLPEPIASLPVEWDTELSPISWSRIGGQEWITLASVLFALDPGRMDVFWVDPTRPSPGNTYVERQPPTRFFSSENGVSGQLVPSPQGFLTCTADRILLIPPPGSGPVRTLAEDIPPRKYNTLGMVTAMPWGNTAMALGCTPDLYHDLYRIDLHSGRSLQLVGQEGLTPGLYDAWSYQISPIPEPRDG